MVRLQAYRLSMMVDRILRPSLGTQHQGQSVMGRCAVWIDGQSPPQVPFSLVRLILFPERHAQVVVGIGIVGVQPQRVLKVGNRCGEAAAPFEGKTQVVVGATIVRGGGDGGLPDANLGDVVLIAQYRGCAQQQH